MKIKTDALILDVDGTLWDSTPLVAEAWTNAIKDEGYDKKVSPDELKGLFGKPMNVIADLLLPEFDEETRTRIMDRCTEYEEDILEKNEKDISFSGVADTIRELSKRISVCIVSNCQSGYIELVCEKLGITGFIADKECYGDTGLYKAENIKLVVERNGYKNPVYCGDIQGDQDASHEAGVPFIHAAYGFGDADAPEAVIKSFVELKDILE